MYCIGSTTNLGSVLMCELRGNVGNYLIGPYLMPSHRSGEIYETFLKRLLLEILEDMPLGIRRRMLFQHDGPPAHFHRNACQYLNNAFPQMWIGHNGPVSWPPRSSDMTPLDLFLWGYINLRNTGGVRYGSRRKDSSLC